ncbi:MAG: prepilin-type N-terminal cleavage/methylation domain-containing protein [Verrucomicrobia bacterium]|nr:prepilin-type N-terminal cleavage/methylation domain-containing protein [Verrucomicrobiota bacterium]
MRHDTNYFRDLPKAKLLNPLPFTRYSLLQGFTLLEVLIALALVAVLLSIAVPYMRDAFGSQQSDQISEAISTLVQQTRAAAMTAHESRYIDFNDASFRQLFPAGWKFQLERMGDQKFHDPASGERWEFNGEGICDPLSLRLQGGGQMLTLKFDPITGEVVHDE